MQVDGGNLDNDAIERDWYQLTVLTSLQVAESEIKEILKEGIQH